MPVMYGYRDVGEQAWMVLDRVRTEAFRRAIEQVVLPGDIVLDIGSGSGILALYAAKAGAAKVYAVERSGSAELIQLHAQANGFADVIEVVRADIFALKRDDLLPKPTVVVSEMLGNFAPDEDVHRITRQGVRLCAPNPRLIPCKYELFFAPIFAAGLTHEFASLMDVGGVSLGCMAERLSNRPLLGVVDAGEVVGPTESGGVFNVDDETPQIYEIFFRLERETPINGIATWFQLHLTDDISVCTAPGSAETHWRSMVLPVHPPMHCRAGDALQLELRPRLIRHRGSYRWVARTAEQVRRGDAMKSLVGTKDDLMSELRLTTSADEYENRNLTEVTKRVQLWARIFAGEPLTSMAEMVARLRETSPFHFPDDDAAREEAQRLLWAAKAPW